MQRINSASPVGSPGVTGENASLTHDWAAMLDRLSGLMQAAGLTQEAERLKACASCPPETRCATCPLNLATDLIREH